ncbi:MAG: T9SS type A sorting domain-containing protein [Candidatus Eisenbacteria bacterium]|nr:T9SS type A sorting domain-containing protein [Candidatus Eisenbacteria bacterium]
MRSSLSAGLLSLFTLLFSSPSACARTWHILPDGTGDAPTIQAGIDSAAAGDTVSLGNGTYSGDGNRDIQFMGKAIVVRSASGDPSLCVLDCQGSAEDQHRGFFFGSGEGRASVLEGITITGGYADAALGWYGGAIRCASSSSPTIRTCVLEGNHAARGGGLYSHGSGPEIRDCVFRSNTTRSGGYGGGAYVEAGSEAPELGLRGCFFDSNGGTATGFGGGLFCGQPRGVIQDCVFRNNRAQTGGGAACFEWGDATFEDCLFEGNHASWMGGGVYWVYSCYAITEEPIVARRCVFVGNDAWTGGGLYLTYSFADDLPCLPNPLQVEECTFFGNASTDEGSCIYANGYGEEYGSCDPPTITSSILAFGLGGEAISSFSDPFGPVLECCDLFGNEGGDWIGWVANQHGVAGNFSADPLSCDAENGDFTLDAASPCLNAPGCGPIGAFGEGCVLTAVAESGPLPRRAFGVFVSPNPANGRAVLWYSLPGNASSTIEVFDLAGRLVRALAAPGAEGSILWDGKDGAGRDVAAGVYFVRAADRDPAETKRVILVR